MIWKIYRIYIPCNHVQYYKITHIPGSGSNILEEFLQIIIAIILKDNCIIYPWLTTTNSPKKVSYSWNFKTTALWDKNDGII